MGARLPKKLLPIFACNMAAYAAAAVRAGATHAALAKAAKIPKSHWSELINGHIPNPSIWTAVCVAEVLRVSLSMMVTTDPAARSATAVGLERLLRRETRGKMVAK
jgi:hypothetical protein